MPRQFHKHYTRDEARALLPELRVWLTSLEQWRTDLEKNDRRLIDLTGSLQDTGGKLVNQSVRLLVEIKHLLREFENRQIIIKDLDRGLIDFPSLIGNREVFLCWEKDEDDVEFWHDIDSGFAGREPL